jgi:hypothetical protein
LTIWLRIATTALTWFADVSRLATFVKSTSEPRGLKCRFGNLNV